MNWEKVKYQKNNLFRIPKKSGLYVICKENKNSFLNFPTNNDVIYVGKSNNLNRRVSEHLSNNETNGALLRIEKNCSLTVFWINLSDSYITSAEKQLIRDLKPSANKIGFKQY